MRAFVPALAALAACAPALHIAATVTEVAAEASLACDAVTTDEIIGSKWHGLTVYETEGGGVLGEFPSTARIAEYFGGIGMALAGFNATFVVRYGQHTEAQRIVADAWRIAANLVIVGVEVDAIRNNAEYGGRCY